MFEPFESYSALLGSHLPGLTRDDWRLLMARAITGKLEEIAYVSGVRVRSIRERLAVLEQTVCLPAGAPEDAPTVLFWTGLHHHCCWPTDPEVWADESTAKLSAHHLRNLVIEDQLLALGRVLYGKPPALARLWLLDATTIRARLARLRRGSCHPLGLAKDDGGLGLWAGLHTGCCLAEAVNRVEQGYLLPKEYGERAGST